MTSERLILADVNPEEGFWVFAYGSLMWNPGFAVAERALARLPGYQRSFCMTSIVYRGTPEAPGLVLALDRIEGTACTGVAYRVDAENGAATLAYLRDRELVSSAYMEVLAEVVIEDHGIRRPALAYVVDRAHTQYCGVLSAEEQARIIARAAGPAGSNRDYLMNTAQALQQLGLEDPSLFDLVDRVKRLP